MKRPVLIVGTEPRIAIPVARSLHRHEVPVDLAAFCASEQFAQSRAISNFVSLPDPERFAQAFLEELLRLISSRGYDLLIPTTDAALEVISRYESTLRQLLYVACPPAEVIQQVLNKSLTLDAAGKAGVHVPESWRVSSATELKTLSGQLRFPLVAKPYHKSEETDFKVRYFEDYDALLRALTDDEGLARKVLLQEFALGDGVGIEMLMHNSEPVAMFQHRRLKEVPARGGAAAIAVSEPINPDLLEQSLALLRALQWEGVAMVEFRYDRERKQSTLMEVNGRYWGTVGLPIRAGIDFPWYQWQIAHGETPSVPQRYSLGTRWRWTAGYIRRWHGIAKSSAMTALRNPRSFKQLLPTFQDITSRDAVWDPFDPMPAISDSLRTLGHLAAADFRALLRTTGRNPRLRENNRAKEYAGGVDG